MVRFFNFNFHFRLIFSEFNFPLRYRRQIGYVAQEPVLFATSIKENIKFGNDEVTDENVIAAAKLANAHEFVSNFDQARDFYSTIFL